MYLDSPRNITSAQKVDIAVRSSLDVARLAMGMSAAAQGAPYCETQGEFWCQGWRLHNRKAAPNLTVRQ